MHAREVRLGIVLYGGVSLAVYENGVAQELHRAVRGDGIYGLIRELIDSDVVVDVISGTSAGGVNGIMLASALANKQQFAPSADLWRKQADIQALLRTESDSEASSVLNSDYYQNKLQDCFAQSLLHDPTAPDIDELDLFITGTDANGDIYTVYDDSGHAIDMKNHRALFKLSYRKGGRKNDLAAPAADLAKLARITSCFPVAFQPVSVTAADTNFFRWGKLRKPAVYMDGGILNNKPFTSTIDAISRRTANRDVERFLIYVEPDPDVFVEPAILNQAQSPLPVQAASGALISIRGYQSIASDLEAIEAHNERADRIAQILDSIPDAPDFTPECLDSVGVLLSAESACDSTAYYGARLIQLRDTAVAGILNASDGRGYISSLDDRRSGRILVESFENWPGDATDTLKEYDVFFRIRRAVHLSRTLMRGVKNGDSGLEDAWNIVNHFFKLYEITEWALITWLNQWEYNWRALGPENPDLDTLNRDRRTEVLTTISTHIWGKAEERLRLLLLAETPIPAEFTATAREEFAASLRKHLDPQEAPVISEAPRNLLHILDDAFKAALKFLGHASAVPLRNEFCHFVEIDRQVFPFQVGADYEAAIPVRVVRFSPRDAQRQLSRGKVTEKVCGLALGAFGGFFKKSWRANDIMVGRLDAACLLTECLLTKERLAVLSAGRTVSAANLIQYFPSLDAAGANTLAGAINTYLAKPAAATQQTWSDLIDQLVGVAHEVIEREEWPRVVASALEQEYAWGRYNENTVPTSSPVDTKKPMWRKGSHKPDEILVSVAASALANNRLPPFTPGAVAGRRFLDEIPDTVLQELGFLSLIRIGKSLTTSIKSAEIRKRFESSRFYRGPFVWVLPVFYKWARMRRTQPESVVILNTAIPIACLLFLAGVIAVLALKAAWFSGTAVTLLLIPIAVFGIWFYLFRR